MNRRKFLGTSASLFATVSVGSSYLGVALPASAQVGGARREVVVGGRLEDCRSKRRRLTVRWPWYFASWRRLGRRAVCNSSAGRWPLP